MASLRIPKLDAAKSPPKPSVRPEESFLLPLRRCDNRLPVGPSRCSRRAPCRWQPGSLHLRRCVTDNLLQDGSVASVLPALTCPQEQRRQFRV